MLPKIYTLVVLLSLLPAAAGAQDHKAELVEQLYHRSGMARQMDQLPLIIQTAFDQAVADDPRFQPLPRSVLAEMRQAIATAYDPAVIKRNIVDACNAQLSVSDVEQVLTWLNAPLGRRITRLEEDASRPSGYLAMQRFASRIQDTPPPAERLDLIQRLDDTVQATETGVEIAANAQLAVTVAALFARPLEQQPDVAEVAAALAQQRSQIQRMVQVQTRIALLYTYQAVADADLAAYIAFAASAAGTRYHEAATSAFKTALLDCAYQWGERIGAVLNSVHTRTDA